MSDEQTKTFQVLMLVRIATNIEAKDQAAAERLAENIAMRAIPLSLSENGKPTQYLTGTVDDVEVADVSEAE